MAEKRRQLALLNAEGIPKRMVMTFVAFIGYTYLFMLRVNINIAIVAMVNYTAIPHTNITVAEECGRQYEEVTHVSEVILFN